MKLKLIVLIFFMSLAKESLAIYLPETFPLSAILHTHSFSTLDNHKLTYTFEVGLTKTTYIKKEKHDASVWIPKVSSSFCFYF